MGTGVAPCFTPFFTFVAEQLQRNLGSRHRLKAAQCRPFTPCVRLRTLSYCVELLTLSFTKRYDHGLIRNNRWNKTNQSAFSGCFSEKVYSAPGIRAGAVVCKQNAPAHEVRFFVNGNRRPCRQPFAHQSVRMWQRLRLAPLPQWQV
jgi:hypothetical protein